MIFQNFEAFARELPEGRPLMGLDLGTRTIGVAVSDVERKIATPHYTIRRKDQKKDMGRLWQLATERNVCGVVIGMPLNMDGSDGPRSQATRAFARQLEMYMPRPLTFWDERLSTVSAERALIEGDTSRKKRELVIDKVAAAIILQGALDRLTFLFGAAPPPEGEAVPAPSEDVASAMERASRLLGDEVPEAAPSAMERAGRAREGRALPRASDHSADQDPPKRNADAVRRRRMMTRRLDRDE